MREHQPRPAEVQPASETGEPAEASVTDEHVQPAPIEVDGVLAPDTEEHVHVFAPARGGEDTDVNSITLQPDGDFSSICASSCKTEITVILSAQLQ